MPRTCTVCKHKDLAKINKDLASGEPYRNIAKLHGIGYSSAFRHAENCLSLALGALIEKRKEEKAVDAIEEFTEQLAFAKKLRLAAELYLSDPFDPLKISLIPFAHEIDVAYFDNTDLTDGENPKPKKKSAKLSMLIADMEELRNFEVDKISIKHVDLRSFAIDALRATDLCVDRFAKISGVYQENRKNAEDEAKAIKAIQDFLERHPDSDINRVVDTFAAGRGISRERITAQLGMIG